MSESKFLFINGRNNIRTRTLSDDGKMMDIHGVSKEYYEVGHAWMSMTILYRLIEKLVNPCLGNSQFDGNFAHG